MNIVSIDHDADHNQLVEKFSQHSGANCFGFTDFYDCSSWLQQAGKSQLPAVDFIFVAVAEHTDKAFAKAIELKRDLKNNQPVIIFMLNQHCDKSYIRALKYGAGYLLKPFGGDLFISAVYHHAKQAEINRLLGKKNKELLEYKKINDREHSIVESIFANHFEQHLFDSDHLNFHISPASVFNGDVLLTEQGPSGSLYLAVGDVTGHGLPAAIGAMPVYSTFREMAKKGMAVGAIAYAMNKSLRTLLPANMMMALIIMKLDYEEAKALIWSGGMPEVIVVDNDSSIVRKIGSRHSPLSMLDPDAFRQDIDIVNLQEGDRLFFYTDGIEEARSLTDEMFGTERFLSLFQGNPALIFNKIVEAHNHFIGANKQDDDITLVEVEYHSSPASYSSSLPIAKSKSAVAAAIQWQMSFTIGPLEIKEADPLAQIINFLNNAVNISVHQDCISTILSELFNNSLDHGLLELDSSEKHTEDGFVNYYIKRRKKILELDQGNIDIDLKYLTNKDQQAYLNITVTDTGKGFDYTSLVYSDDNVSRGYGHGLQLVKSLCESVTQSNNGQTMTAVYRID